jgi:hypothetical protein
VNDAWRPALAGRHSDPDHHSAVSLQRALTGRAHRAERAVRKWVPLVRVPCSSPRGRFAPARSRDPAGFSLQEASGSSDPIWSPQAPEGPNGRTVVTGETPGTVVTAETAETSGVPAGQRASNSGERPRIGRERAKFRAYFPPVARPIAAMH